MMINRLLYTGASGFLGSNTLPHLCQYDVTTLGNSVNDTVYCDISNHIPQLNDSYDVVLHAAGKAHSVPKNREQEDIFWEVNLMGTKNLCQALENTSKLPHSFVFISTVAVYGIEVGDNIDETAPTNPTTAYGKSKLAAEEFLTTWAKKNSVNLVILRPSLIAGRTPVGNLGAMINGIKTKRYLSIGKSEARKSVLMAQDIARLLPMLYDVQGVFNVCDDSQPSFKELEVIIAKQLNMPQPKSIPMWVAKCIAKMGDLLGAKSPINTDKLSKITQSLTFSNEKLKQATSWQPLKIADNFVIQ